MAGRRPRAKPAYHEARLDRRHPLARGLSGLWLLGEGGGTGVVNLARGSMYSAAFNGAAAWGLTRRGVGVVSSASSGTAAAELVPDSGTILPTQSCTIVLGYRKRDATLRATAAIGLSASGASANYCHALVPYSDGVVYWDFGGTSAGTTRLSVGSLTFGDDLWVFTTGPRGMEIWQNGILRASNGANPTRTQLGSSGFSLGSGAGLGMDYAEWWYAATYTRQLAPGEIVALTADPFALLQPRRRVFKVPVGAAVTGAATPTLALTVAAAGSLGAGGAATPALSLTVAASGARAVPGAATPTGTLVVAAAGSLAAVGAAAAALALTVAAAGEVMRGGAAALSATLAVSPTAAVGETGAAALTGTLAVAASTAVDHPGAAALTATATVSAATAVGRPGAAALTASVAVAPTAAVSVTGAAALAGSLVVAAAGGTSTAHQGAAALSAGLTVTATAAVAVAGNVALAGTLATVASGRVAVAGLAALSATGTLAAAGQVLYAGAAPLTATATLTASGAVVGGVAPGRVTLSASVVGGGATVGAAVVGGAGVGARVVGGTVRITTEE